MTKITHKRYDIAFGLVLAVAFGLNIKAAKSETLTVRIVRDVPTVAGIRQAPTAHRFYDARQGIVTMRPTAGVQHVLREGGAPANGCSSPAFEVVSGPKAQRGCYGSN